MATIWKCTSRQHSHRMTAEEARRQAAEAGGVEQIKESYRERRGLPGWKRWFGCPLRRAHAVQNTDADVILAITLALGIGVNAAIFAYCGQLPSSPLPVPHAQQIVRLATSKSEENAPLGVTAFSYPDLADFRKQGTIHSPIYSFTSHSLSA